MAEANWYPDPEGRFDYRYWDGSQWTAYVSRNGQQMESPIGAPPARTDGGAERAEQAGRDETIVASSAVSDAGVEARDAGVSSDASSVADEVAQHRGETSAATRSESTRGAHAAETSFEVADSRTGSAEPVASDEDSRETSVDDEVVSATTAEVATDAVATPVARDDLFDLRSRETQAEPEREPEPELEAEPEPEAELKPEPEPEPERFADVVMPPRRSEVAAAAVTSAIAESEPDPEPETTAEPEPEPASTAELEPEPEVRPDPWSTALSTAAVATAASAPAASVPAAEATSPTLFAGLSGDLVDGDFAEKVGVGPQLQNPRMLRVRVTEPFLGKQGAMVAYQGNVDFAYKGSGAAKFVKKAFTREGLDLMTVSGQGDVFLADEAREVHILQLRDSGLSVNGRNVLAFSAGLEYDIERVRGAALATGGLFNTTLRGTGWVAITTDGEPVVLNAGEAATYADTNAIVAWSTTLETSVRSTFKASSLIGRGSGESFQLAFRGEGFVIVQPSEAVEVPVQN